MYWRQSYILPYPAWLDATRTGRKIGISPSTLNKVERGAYNQNVSIAMLLDIAEGLDVDVTYFLTITEADKKVLF